MSGGEVEKLGSPKRLQPPGTIPYTVGFLSSCPVSVEAVSVHV
jgi:hypothetical protein